MDKKDTEKFPGTSHVSEIFTLAAFHPHIHYLEKAECLFRTDNFSIGLFQ